MQKGDYLSNQTGAFGIINSLIIFLENVGFDISYGEEGGRIFSRLMNP